MILTKDKPTQDGYYWYIWYDSYNKPYALLVNVCMKYQHGRRKPEPYCIGLGRAHGIKTPLRSIPDSHLWSERIEEPPIGLS